MLNRLILVALCSILPSAYAAHPLVTDDGGTQGKGNNQIEMNTDRVKQGGAKSHSAAFTYSYGVAENLDAIFNLPASLSSPRGIGDASLGLKWRFVENDASTLALKPELLLATGNPDKGLGNGRAGLAMTLIGSHEVGQWTYLANIGLAMSRYESQADRDANRRTTWRTSVGITYLLNEKWKLVADTGIEQESDRSSRDHPVFLLAGFIYSPIKDLDLDAGYKSTISCGQCASGRERQFGVGLTWRF